MMLTECQKHLRSMFRDALIMCWHNHKTMNSIPWIILGMPEIPHAIALEKILWEIPSIGEYFGKESVSVWLARHYPKTSMALFDKKSDAQVLAVWNKEKRAAGNNRLVSNKDQRNELNRKKATKFIRARALDKSHDWNTVK